MQAIVSWRADSETVIVDLDSERKDEGGGYDSSYSSSFGGSVRVEGRRASR